MTSHVESNLMGISIDRFSDIKHVATNLTTIKIQPSKALFLTNHLDQRLGDQTFHCVKMFVLLCWDFDRAAKNKLC